MKKAPLIDESNVWKKLMVLGKKQGSIRLKDLSLEMGLSEEGALSFIRQAFPHATGVEVYFQDDENWVDIDAEAIQYVLPLSPDEWMELGRLLDTKQKMTSPALESLKQKIIENAPVRTLMKILGKLDDWSEEMSAIEKNLVSILDKMILEKKMVRATTTDHKIYTIFPCKVLHLEGELSLVAEDSQDHCLLVIPMHLLADVDPLPSTSIQKSSEYEVEEFITAIRSMNEKESRLILKIHDPVGVNLFPQHHFLGKPCMITNPNGDLIWAAYVEPGAALYEWLISLGKHVEILDPLNFKEEYLTYCEEKLKNVA